MIYATAVMGLVAAGASLQTTSAAFSGFSSFSKKKSSAPECGVVHENMGLADAPFFKDIGGVGSVAKCVEICKETEGCVALSYKKKNGGCWLREEFGGLMNDESKDSFILCPGAPGLDFFDIGEDVDGDEGDEGNEGGSFNRESGSSSSGASCSAVATASSVSFNLDQIIVATAESRDILCNPDVKNQIDPRDIEIIWDKPALALANAIADVVTHCSSFGDAFGCAAAEAQAAAWAEAHGRALASAYAEAFNGCGICDSTAVQTEAKAEVSAATFVDLVADAYSRAQAQACVAGTQVASAAAWSNCFAKSFALLSAKAMADGYISGNCHNAKAEVFVQVATDAKYTNVEKCAQGDFGFGNGSGSTSDSFSFAGARTN